MRLLATGALACSIGMSVATAEDWPTFRGADRTGVAPETGLISEFPASGPRLLFDAKGAGRGYASPAVADGKMVTLGDGPSTAGDKMEYLSCFDANTGKHLWMVQTGEAWNKGKDSWQGSRGTPTIDGDMVYVITPFGRLIAAEMKNGNIVWERDLMEELGGKKKDSWGYSESPLIDGDLLICTPGGVKNTVVALNKKTGQEAWSCSRENDTGAGHSSVVIANVAGRKIYVQNTSCGPMGVDAQSGELLWEYFIDPPTAFIPTPIVFDNYVFTVAGYGTGGALLKQSATSNGVDVEEVYGLKTILENKHGGVILIDGKLYYGKGDASTVFCSDVLSGEVLWKERGKGRNSIAIGAADGKLFLRYQDGTVEMATASPAGFTSLGSFKAPGSGGGDQPSWAHPVIANKRLYLRENDSILCYDLAE
jgi:outer membrane protein assembly factor BamB